MLILFCAVCNFLRPRGNPRIVITGVLVTSLHQKVEIEGE
nr:MAG TPA: hypothetical protein [Inoviridae sp.]